MTTLFYTFGISLFDSLSTTIQIIAFVLLLTTEKPLRNALSFLAGVCGAYFLCGVGGYLVLDQLRELFNRLFPQQSNISNPSYYQTELFIGVGLVVWGVWYFYKKKRDGWSGAENKLISKLKSINSWLAFCVGVVISITSFSFPYLVALGKFAELHLALPVVIGFILFYNFGYALPMVLILLVYLKMRQSVDIDHDELHEKAKMLNIYLTAWTMVGFGIFSIIDAGCYFVLGQALMKDRFF